MTISTNSQTKKDSNFFSNYIIMATYIVQKTARNTDHKVINMCLYRGLLLLESI